MSLKRKGKNRRFERRHVLDVKLRSSHRRQMRFRRLALVLIFLGTVFGGGFAAWRGGDLLLQHFIYRNPAFTIHELDIQTDGVLAREQLVRWAGVKIDENLFALDLARVKRDLELVPAIETVVVRRVLPNKLRIRVTERDPVARVSFSRPAAEGGDQLYLLDGQGFVMFPLEAAQLASVQAPDYSPLPALLGISANDLRPGRRLNDERVRAALQLITTFSRSSMVGLARFRTIDVHPSGFLQATTDDRCTVSLGLGNFDAQLRRWRAIHDHGRRFGRRIGDLDLSVSNNVPVRWLDASIEAMPRPQSPELSPKRKNV